MKDYYKILGVLQEAEDIVIKAAYKALIQRYHPDRWKGDPQEAHDKITEINEAYSILSDSAKRKEYDKNFTSSENRAEYEEELNQEYQNQNYSNSSNLNKDWELAETIFHDLKSISTRLNTISKALFEMYRDVMLDQKQFNLRAQIAKKLEDNFLSLYFGKNPEIKAFASELILNHNKKDALMLNKLIKILGDTSPDELIFKIKKEQEDRKRKKIDPYAERKENQKKTIGAFLVTKIANDVNNKIKVNDIIYELNGQDVRGKSKLFEQLLENSRKNNEQLNMKIVRDLSLLNIVVPANQTDFKFVQLAY